MKLRGLVPNSYIHVSVRDEDRSAYLAAGNRQTVPRKTHRYMNVEIGRQNIIILFWK
jgi:hypothetical protein